MAGPLDALRDPVTCVVGYVGLIADAAARGERPDDAWVTALDVSAFELLSAIERLDAVLAELYAAAGS